MKSVFILILFYFIFNSLQAQNILNLKKGDTFTNQVYWQSSTPQKVDVRLLVKCKVAEIDSLGNFLLEFKLLEAIPLDNTTNIKDIELIKNKPFNMILYKNYSLKVLEDRDFMPHIINGFTSVPLFFPKEDIRKNSQWIQKDDLSEIKYKVHKITKNKIYLVIDGKYIDRERKYNVILDKRTGLIMSSDMISKNEKQKIIQVK
jgi:hypothetical protein